MGKNVRISSDWDLDTLFPTVFVWDEGLFQVVRMIIVFWRTIIIKVKPYLINVSRMFSHWIVGHDYVCDERDQFICGYKSYLFCLEYGDIHPIYLWGMLVLKTSESKAWTINRNKYVSDKNVFLRRTVIITKEMTLRTQEHKQTS